MDGKELETQIVAFVRAFGLHKAGETPCGQPLSVAEAYVLMELMRDAELSQRVLVARLNLAKSTVSRLLMQMHHRGWLARHKDATDRRVWLWRLSAEGRRIARNVSDARQQKFDALLRRVPTESHAVIADALTLLVEASRDGGNNN